jgi:TolB-like protein/tetratricopeptide (TPR) repeat protein
MHADRWRRVEELYHAASARPVAERGAFLSEVCAGDARLREEVASLLAQPVSADGPLEHAARGVASPTMSRFAAGTRLGPYEIAGPLGTGGMGEVYRARDSQLNRDVALKVLPELSALDPDRLARFRREAQVLASLNHPNIGAIYGLEDAGPSPGSEQAAIRALVLELVDGPTLAERIAQGPIPLQDALPIARQVCEALAAAHEQGVVHRDLKPANIKLRPDGTVKVLDFGLAKVFLGEGSRADRSQSPTVAAGGTQEGLILGTAAYMSPEQARGLAVDKRTDIWAFGCVLDEMLTGRARFHGPTVTDTLAAILEREPEWDTLPGATPPAIRRVLQRCLEKDPKRRLRDIADARMEIEDALGGGARTGADAAIDAPTRVRVRRRWALAMVTSLVALTAVGTLTWYMRAAPQARTAAWRWLAPPEAPSVAVLPFSTIGDGDPYFADGMTEAVTTELGRVVGMGLQVTASNSTFAYRDRTDLREIARDLGVGLVVMGSVRRADGMVRIDARLVDTRDGTVLWSEGYDRKLTDVLTVQADISREIAATLGKTFASEPEANAPSLTTKNPDAVDAYLRGISHLKGRSSPTPNVSDWTAEREREEAIAELGRAVDLDNNFALARATLASAYTQRFFYDEADPALATKAFIEIRKALAIDPNLAEAYLARAQLKWSLGYRFPHPEAISDLRRALRINPSLAEAHIELGKIYLHIGLTDKAIDANEQAERLDPGAASPLNRRVGALIDDARLEEVRRELERYGTRLRPQYLADAWLVLGKPADALEVLKGRKNTNDPESDATHAALRAVVYATLGRTEEADRALAEATLVAKNPTGLSHMHHAQFYVGSALALLGRHNEAVQWLTQAVDEGYQSYPKFSTDPSLVSLKGHAGFAALLARLRKDRDRWLRTL